jgi:hypothetical protein
MTGVTAGALTAGGCGESGNGLAEAAERTQGAPGYAVSFTSTVRVSADDAPLVVTGRGSVDNRRHRTRIALTGAVDGEEIVDGAQSATVYLSAPKLLAGKRWVRFELASPNLNAGAVALAQGNPAQYVRALGDSADGARKVGGGIYAATIPVAGRARPARVWVGDGYVRRLQFSYSIPVPGSQTTIAYRTTIRFGPFGPVAPIALPAAGEVTRIGADGKPKQ